MFPTERILDASWWLGIDVTPTIGGGASCGRRRRHMSCSSTILILRQNQSNDQVEYVRLLTIVCGNHGHARKK